MRQFSDTDVEMGGEIISKSEDRVEKRERNEEGESTASKATRLYKPKGEMSKREDDAIQEQPAKKVINISGESRGEVARDMTTARQAFDPEGAMWIQSIMSRGKKRRIQPEKKQSLL